MLLTWVTFIMGAAGRWAWVVHSPALSSTNTSCQVPEMCASAHVVRVWYFFPNNVSCGLPGTNTLIKKDFGVKSTLLIQSIMLYGSLCLKYNLCICIHQAQERAPGQTAQITRCLNICIITGIILSRGVIGWKIFIHLYTPFLCWYLHSIYIYIYIYLHIIYRISQNTEKIQ